MVASKFIGRLNYRFSKNSLELQMTYLSKAAATSCIVAVI